MRIIGGEFKGRRFDPPAKNWPTRPTTDFAKEGLFNILANYFDFAGLKVLDLFGGTGNHSYEFISRGCRDVTYVDNFPGCVRFVKKTAGMLGIEDRITIVKADVFQFIGSAAAHYGLPLLDTIPDRIFEADLLRPGGWLVLEHNPHHHFREHPHYWQERNYGKTIFTFFRKEEPEDGAIV